MAVKNALSYVSGGEIPKLDAPVTGEEILMRLTHYSVLGAQRSVLSGARSGAEH